MRLTKVRMVFATAAALALMVGVGSAIAATGGGGLKQEAARITDRASMEAAVAKNLGTTAAKLKAAVKAAATARIDAALAAGAAQSAAAAAAHEATNNLPLRPLLGTVKASDWVNSMIVWHAQRVLSYDGSTYPPLLRTSSALRMILLANR